MKASNWGNIPSETETQSESLTSGTSEEHTKYPSEHVTETMDELLAERGKREAQRREEELQAHRQLITNMLILDN